MLRKGQDAKGMYEQDKFRLFEGQSIRAAWNSNQ